MSEQVLIGLFYATAGLYLFWKGNMHLINALQPDLSIYVFPIEDRRRASEEDSDEEDEIEQTEGESKDPVKGKKE